VSQRSGGGSHVDFAELAYKVEREDSGDAAHGFKYRKCGAWFWVLGAGFWVLASGYWFLGAGFWVLVSGYWLLVDGFWVLASG
jgi:hypothetical protein